MMKNQPPSIFNDVMGPVMRGPSSSHTAASVRIGNLVRQFFNEDIHVFSVEFESQGSLATTYKTQGSDFGLIGGLLGMNLDDDRLLESAKIAHDKGIEVNFSITRFDAEHPNTYRVTAADRSGKEFCFIFISTGGGMFELKEINGAPVSVKGDFYETFLFIESKNEEALERYMDRINKLFPDHDYSSVVEGDGFSLINIKTDSELPSFVRKVIELFDKISTIVYINPVLPVRSRKELKVPFITDEELLKEAEKRDLELWKLAVLYEMERGDISSDEVLQLGKNILQTMNSSIKEGLEGKDFSNRILEPQAVKMSKYEGNLIGGEVVKKIITYTTAVMDSKSSMEVIVAAPTAGACGVMPGILFAVSEEEELEKDTPLKGLFAAAAIGILIVNKSTFAAEECGCQAECGSASAMAAAGLVQIYGGTVKQSLDAAAMALQNIMGMICDPVAERVEVPCLGKNVLAAVNALACANMALSGFINVIPLGETIEAFDRVGRMLPAELRCTGGGGLSKTPSARALFQKLDKDINH